VASMGGDPTKQLTKQKMEMHTRTRDLQIIAQRLNLYARHAGTQNARVQLLHHVFSHFLIGKIALIFHFSEEIYGHELPADVLNVLLHPRERLSIVFWTGWIVFLHFDGSFFF
jgi:hypothetical protein